MTRILTTCDRCGDVEITPADARVRVSIEEDRGEYSFRCPRCALVNHKPAEGATIDLLAASGVAFASEPPFAHSQPPRPFGRPAPRSRPMNRIRRDNGRRRR